MASASSPPVYIYVIGWAHGWQKVGFSSRPKKRAEMLRRAGMPPFSVHYEVEVERDAVRGIEALAHWLLSPHHMEGEWFGVAPQEAITAVNDAVSRHAAGERRPAREDLMTERRQIVCTASWVAAVEEWCKHQPGRAPTFSDAVRTLVDRALEADRPTNRPPTEGEGA